MLIVSLATQIKVCICHPEQLFVSKDDRRLQLFVTGWGKCNIPWGREMKHFVSFMVAKWREILYNRGEFRGEL